jgi:hypothetical protein
MLSRVRPAGFIEPCLLASDHDNEYMMIDATIVRAHQHSAGAFERQYAAFEPAAFDFGGAARDTHHFMDCEW